MTIKTMPVTGGAGDIGSRVVSLLRHTGEVCVVPHDRSTYRRDALTRGNYVAWRDFNGAGDVSVARRDRLMPDITRRMELGRETGRYKPISIFGAVYDTRDRTCVPSGIRVEDRVGTGGRFEKLARQRIDDIESRLPMRRGVRGIVEMGGRITTNSLEVRNGLVVRRASPAEVAG
jgi:UDP-glucose 4-epimerase